MRYALRNRSKIEEVLGEDFLNTLISSLKEYSKVKYAPVILNNRKIIKVHSIKSNNMLIFVVLSQTYDVVHVAYYKSI